MAGRKLESLKLYEDGIAEVLKLCKSTTDLNKKKHIQTKLDEYIGRAEQIKESIRSWSSRGEIKDRIHIAEGATNYGYDQIFSKYLTDDVEEILVDEPYIREFYQVCNFVIFCELAVSKCRNLKCIKLTTNKDTNPNSEQNKGLQLLIENLAKYNVNLYVDYTNNLHDRQVLLSSGNIIKIGRGLHYFKPLSNRFCLGAYNLNFRECRETNVDIFYCPENYKA